MDYLTKKKFDFRSAAQPPDTFGVVSFKGAEGFSRCYEFEINLVSEKADIDLAQMLDNPATLTILREEGDIPFNGILAQFEQLHEAHGYVFYRAALVPKLWWLGLTYHNQVFLDTTVPEILDTVLKDGGLTALDFDLRLQKDYPKREYVCQYRESHLNFTCRWMEREGIYFYFEQNENGEKVVITDTSMSHIEMSEGKTMYYSPPSGLDEPYREEVIKAFICRQKMLPAKVLLKDYNYRKPSVDMTGQADVTRNGRGEVFIYGEHFRTPEEGDSLARIRAEELLCQEKRFMGESTIPYLRPGYLFDLEDHYRDDFNQKYLTIELEHEGSQAGYLVAGLQEGLSEMEKQPYYRNSFTAIPSSVQYRPVRQNEKPRFSGTMNAKIDAAGLGKYAELDGHGRYKVLLPFDLSGRKDGKASAYFRMAQPYAGTDHGMHFPLHKGTEVLLTFIDGDPDRPIIAAAVPNPDNPSVINAGNPTTAGFKTAGGNQISMQDDEGHQRIILSAGDGKARIICGSGSGDNVSSEAATQAHSADCYITAGAITSAVLSSFSYTAMSGSFIPQVAIKLAKMWGDEMQKADQLGYRADYDSKLAIKTKFNTISQLLLTIIPKATDLFINDWLVYSFQKQLDKKMLTRKEAKFGPIRKDFKKAWAERTWSNKFSTGLKATLKFVDTMLIGRTGPYGVLLFSHNPKIFKWSPTWFRWLLDPRCASVLKLNKAKPDVLVGSSKGHVDIVAAENVNIFADKQVNIEAHGDAAIEARVIDLGAGAGHIRINNPLESWFRETDSWGPSLGSLELEYVSSLISLKEKTIEQRSDEEIALKTATVDKDGKVMKIHGLISISSEPQRASWRDDFRGRSTRIDMESETCFLSLDSKADKLVLKVAQDRKSKALAEINMDLSKKSIEIKADQTVNISAPTINIGGDKVKSIKIGKSDTDLEFKGRKANWKIRGKILIGS